MCVRLQAPMVLAHGLFGFGQVGVGRLTFASYFRGIPESLRAGGNRVVVTRVPPIAGVKKRARRLGEQIEAAFPDKPVHIISHSMGGLDARQLLADPAWSGRILSLTTIGTPHLGSALADCARLRVGRVYRLLRVMRIDHRGFLDVTRRAMRAINKAAARPHAIPCFSIAGDPTVKDVCWPLRGLYEALHEMEGPNDGLVSVESALAFGTPLPAWPVDHLRQMNWLAPMPGMAVGPPAIELYEAVVKNLARHGFAAEDDPEDRSAPPGSSPASRWKYPRFFAFGRRA